MLRRTDDDRRGAERAASRRLRRPHVGWTAIPAAVQLAPGLVALALAMPAAAAEPHGGAVAVPVQTRALSHFDLSDPSRRRFGDLDFLGGLVVRASDERFSSLSGLTLDSTGTRMLAVSDFGFWISARIVAAEDGRPTDLTDVLVAPMLDAGGKPRPNTPLPKRLVDAEAIAALPGRTGFIVSMEGRGLVRFDGDPPFAARMKPVALPPWLTRLPSNRGIEAVATRSVNGESDLVAFAETADRDGRIRGGVLKAGRWKALALKARDGFSVTDAAFLPGGDLLVLERLYRRPLGLYMRLRRIGALDLAGTAPLDGLIVAEADFGDEIDNMEGLGLHRDPAGRELVTLVSDDNRSMLQRTLILRFALASALPLPKPDQAAGRASALGSTIDSTMR
ncbi:hypothetical protein SAMN02745172_00940 [Pseudoxanthobacter soli DSM 19599]|uniref:Phytase-like domain-containing protein n=1 Tax=Pseudoxanthobacter soli DSM 19599 TaxID=1123029 RepID=A0A1M7ZBQ8_9HYPH|nr:hypothetical protein SAMN02745172_00940 [Pseudoxanthobacter soli DSM 19599]